MGQPEDAFERLGSPNRPISQDYAQHEWDSHAA